MTYVTIVRRRLFRARGRGPPGAPGDDRNPTDTDAARITATRSGPPGRRAPTRRR